MKDLILTKFKIYALMGVAMALAFFISSFLSSELFLDYSPKVRPFLAEYVQLNAVNFLSSITGTKKIQPPVTTQYLEAISKQVAPGVRAAETEGYGYTSYTEGKVEWVRHTYTTKEGKTVIIEVPKGMNYVKTE